MEIKRFVACNITQGLAPKGLRSVQITTRIDHEIAEGVMCHLGSHAIIG